jgi:LPS-assembly protein
VPDYPDALPVGPIDDGDTAVVDSVTQSVIRSGDDKILVLDGAVVVTYRNRELRADHIEYDTATGEANANGHLLLTGGPNAERLEASHGTFNLKNETGRFYDARGSVEMIPHRKGTATSAKLYTNGRPFLFTGKLIVKTGPTSYDLYEGTVTSCQLPRPDWLFSAEHFAVAAGEARGYNSTFRLLSVPILYLPYVNHPTDPESRQSGFMIPSVGRSSTKGLTTHEEFYLVLGRSADLNIGTSYYSSIGWEQSATFRYRGTGLDFAKFHFTGVLDKRSTALNQGGQDAVLSLRHDLSPQTRFASDLEYLSSYVYREAFTDNFNQAVTSDILSRVYLTHETNGIEIAALNDRYQGIKLIAQGTSPQQQVRIFHAPTVSLNTTEHRLAGTPIELTLETSVTALKRTQPNFETGGMVERVDVHPEVAVPFALGGWRFRPSFGMEETAYSRSYSPAAGVRPAQQNQAALSRSDIQLQFEIRSPVVERVFHPTVFTGLFGSELKHTAEVETTYRLTRGVDDFKHVLRFDALDVVADTDEVEYGMTQRLFRKRKSSKTCGSAETLNQTANLPDAPDAAIEEQFEGGLNPDPTLSVGNEVGAYGTGTELCQSDELISWRLTQKSFVNASFGGAIVDGRRNIFDTTLDLSGVAFLTEPRNISPLVSRMRLRASTHADLEWDFDFDTGAKKFTSSNVLLDLHAPDGLFGAMSYARLDAPGRFYTEGVTNTSTTGGVSTAVSDFNQLRLLAGYGSPAKRGLSVAANSGIDLKALYGATSTSTSTTGHVTTTTVYPALLQYATLQANYNWDCCGLSVEYRKFELGSVRNEGSYRFNFTLANIGTAGNLRRTERLF